MADGNTRKHLTGRIVVDITIGIVRAAVTMARVCAKTHIRKHYQIGERFLQRRNRPLHDTAHIRSGGTYLILLALCLTEKKNTGNPCRELGHQSVDRPTVLTGH
jgi:hypothetical protein